MRAQDLYLVAPWVAFACKQLNNGTNSDYDRGLPFEVALVQFPATVFVAVTCAEWLVVPAATWLRKKLTPYFSTPL